MRLCVNTKELKKTGMLTRHYGSILSPVNQQSHRWSSNQIASESPGDNGPVMSYEHSWFL